MGFVVSALLGFLAGWFLHRVLIRRWLGLWLREQAREKQAIDKAAAAPNN